jgi:DNA-damage-inducible protein J
MPKSATIHARIEPGLKEEAEAILKELGLNATQAITLFYQQVKINRGLPFVLRVVPNETTRQTIDDTDAEKNLVFCRDADDLFQRLNL